MHHLKDTISKMHASFLSRSSICNINVSVMHHPSTLFKLVSLTKVIASSLNKSCELDHIPTYQLKSCIHVITVPLTTITNVSLCYELFPTDFKYVHWNLMKKQYLLVNALNSHIYIVFIMYKVLEKSYPVVAHNMYAHV